MAIAGKLTAGSSLNGGDGFQCHVAGALDGPFVALLEQDRADEADDGLLIGEAAAPAVAVDADRDDHQEGQFHHLWSGTRGHQGAF